MRASDQAGMRLAASECVGEREFVGGTRSTARDTRETRVHARRLLASDTDVLLAHAQAARATSTAHGHTVRTLGRSGWRAGSRLPQFPDTLYLGLSSRQRRTVRSRTVASKGLARTTIPAESGMLWMLR